VVAAGICLTLGCSSEPKIPELTPALASTLITRKWSRDEFNHFPVSFHSDTLIECGVRNDLWKLAEISDRGYTRTAYQLTAKGAKTLFAIDLKGSGKGHEITLRGPYLLELTNITPGNDPDTRRVEFHWQIDWDKAAAELKACVPKFEMAGNLVGLFKLNGVEWSFVSYSKPEESPQPPAAPAAPEKPF
jgi:hypothetical protein